VWIAAAATDAATERDDGARNVISGASAVGIKSALGDGDWGLRFVIFFSRLGGGGGRQMGIISAEDLRVVVVVLVLVLVVVMVVLLLLPVSDFFKEGLFQDAPVEEATDVILLLLSLVVVVLLLVLPL